MLRIMLEDARAAWRAGTPAERLLAGAGLALTMFGLLLLIPWLWRGDGWAGPLSWRKPVLFGVATGVTLVSLGWALSLMRRPSDWAWAVALSLAAWVEVGLIALQCARGRPSHYVAATTVDGVILAVIEVSAVALLIGLLALSWRALGPLQASADLALALRAGLGLLLASGLIGAWMSVRGPAVAASGAAPELFGAAGVLKFWHGAALHALQGLPLLAWLGRRRGLGEGARWRVVAAASASQLLLFAYAGSQVLRGRGRLDADWLSGPLLGASLLLALAAALPLLRGSRRSRQPARSAA